MKRMTIRNSDCTVSQPTNLNWENVLYRLAAYEDTGLEPEEIYEVRFLIAAQRDPQKLSRLSDLVLADQDGRLVVLPCKVGDTVYGIKPVKKVDGSLDYEMKHGDVLAFKILESGVICMVSAEEQFGYPVAFRIEDFGKTVFLTREEADAALSGKGGAK